MATYCCTINYPNLRGMIIIFEHPHGSAHSHSSASWLLVTICHVSLVRWWDLNYFNGFLISVSGDGCWPSPGTSEGPISQNTCPWLLHIDWASSQHGGLVFTQSGTQQKLHIFSNLVSQVMLFHFPYILSFGCLLDHPCFKGKRNGSYLLMGGMSKNLWMCFNSNKFI